MCVSLILKKKNLKYLPQIGMREKMYNIGCTVYTYRDIRFTHICIYIPIYNIMCIIDVSQTTHIPPFLCYF